MNASDLPDETLFENALACRTPGERTAFLDRACAGQPDLRRRVDALLAAHEASGEFLEPPVAARPDLPLDLPPDETPGAVIGRYKLLQKIGEGGMGVVYMAEQTEPVMRKVALKIIKLGMDTQAVVARFEAERQALALMDHPNIAKVLDAGATETGRPYFVMELVHGVPITEYCDKNKITTKARLELFIPVCRAIQHAHQKGIIHRDIKPSNVMVTLHDGVPVPKVIDFGVAKATNQRLTEKTLFTHYAQVIGTPAYMSPEQAEMSGLDIDTRSDIYSLGVLLYELLTGTTPFSTKDLLSKGYAEMQRIITQQEPLKPSTRMSTLREEEKTVVANNRSMDAGSLRRVLQGDLDWIVMKCLEKDRARRYETSNGLAADLRRHLSNELISARPPTTAYLLNRLVKRNKVAFAAGAMVAASLVAGIAMASWQAIRAHQAEREARRQALVATAAEREQKNLRAQAEAEAYCSEMASAYYSASIGGGLGGVNATLERWTRHEPDLCGWEWYYLYGLCHPETQTIRASSSGLNSIAWSPDGKYIASCGNETNVAIWDASTGRKQKELAGRGAGLTSLSWSPNGQLIVSGSDDGTLKTWDVEAAMPQLTFAGHSNRVKSVRWSPDGATVAAISNDQTVKLWNSQSGVEAHTLRAPNRASSIDWSADGGSLAAVGRDGTVTIWRLADGQPELSMTVDGNNVASWSPDRKWLATGDNRTWVQIWDVSARRCIRTNYHDSAVHTLAWSSDSTRLASASIGDGEIKVWELPNWQQTQSFRGHQGSVVALSWTPNGQQLASAGRDGAIKVWPLTTPRPLKVILTKPDQALSLSWNSNGRHLAHGSGDGSVWVWDTLTAEGVLAVKHASGVWRVAWSPKRDWLASGSINGVLKLWDRDTGRELWSTQSRSSQVRGIAWSPDGLSMATTGGERWLGIHDAETGRLNASFDLKTPYNVAVAWSPDGHTIAAGPGEVVVLQYPALTIKWRSPGHTEGIRDLAWSPDGRFLASAGNETVIKIYDGETGRELDTLRGHVAQVYSVAWSPDGTRLVSSSWDGTMKLWNPANGRLLCSLGGGGDRPSDPWNPETHRRRADMPWGEDAALQSAQWSPDGRRIAAANLAGQVIIRDETYGRTIGQGKFRSK